MLRQALCRLLAPSYFRAFTKRKTGICFHQLKAVLRYACQPVGRFLAPTKRKTGIEPATAASLPLASSQSLEG